MVKTTHRFDWQKGYTKARILSRSFNTLEQAQQFANNKQTTDIYVSKGRYKVEWKKTVDNN